jgi:putative flippase GtrA
MTLRPWRPIVVRWLKFNLVGGIGITVQLLMLILLETGLHFNYLIATALAVETAVVHNFLWHERFTWADRADRGLTRFLKFHLTAGLFSIAGNLAFMKLLVGIGHVNYLLANGITITACSVVSPRWSPDGRFLAALSTDSQKLLLFDFKTQKWTNWLSEPHAVGFPTWSRDSKYLYFDSTFSNDQSYRRLKVGETKPEPVVSLKDIRRYINWIGSWSGLAPDGTPLFVRDISTQEIYALDVQLP